MSTQSIIVYRNPMEAAMWEGIMNSDFPIILFCILTLIISVALFLIYDKVKRHLSYRVDKALNRWSDAVIVAILAVSCTSSYFILV